MLRLPLATVVCQTQRRRDAAGPAAALLYNRRRRQRRGHLALGVQEQLLHVAGRAGVCEFFGVLVLEVAVAVVVVVAWGEEK